MKFITLFATLSTIAKITLASYCGRQCDPNKIPETPLSGPLQLVAVVDNKDSSIRYNVAGTVVIENDCVFTVKGFQLTPKSDGAKWYGASDPNSSEGILLSKEEVGVTSSPTDLTYNIKDTDLFCHASLLSDIGNGGVLRLMDKNYQLLGFAKIAPGLPQSTVAKTTVVAATTKATTKASTTTTQKATNKTTTTTKKASTTTTKKATTAANATTTVKGTTVKSTTVAPAPAPTTTVQQQQQAADAQNGQAAAATPEATKPGNATENATPVAAANQGNSTNTNGSLVPVVTASNNKPAANNNQSSGALSSYKIPSLALYVVLFVIAFVRL